MTAVFQLSLRAAVAAGLAVAIAHFFQLQYPLYALIAAVLVTDLSPSATRRLGLPRLAGTVLGAALGATLGSLVQAGAWVLGLGVFAGMFLSHLLRLQAAAKVTAYVCGVVLLNHGHEPWSYAWYRILETVLGIATAAGVSFVPKLLRTDTKKQPDA